MSVPKKGNSRTKPDTETNTPGKDYTLWVSGEGSHPFDIGKDVYKKLKYDALAFFYQNRSGIEIKMPFAGDKSFPGAAIKAAGFRLLTGGEAKDKEEEK